MRKEFVIMALVCILGVSSICSADNSLPVNDPVRKFQLPAQHWSASVKWNKITSVTTISGLLDVNYKVDSLKLVEAMKNISSKGGGVLFFPAGVYYFSFSLPLYNGVVLRGADPVKAEQNVAQYPTRFEFPQLTLNKNGKPLDAAGKAKFCYTPKIVYNPEAVTDVVGLVNIDINRAPVVIGTRNFPAVAKLLLIGVRSNNAALTDPAVPSAFQIKNKREWQIWPDHHAGNFTIGYTDKCLVAGCIINDNTADNIPQYDYMTGDGMIFDGSKAVFSFTDHAAVSIHYQGRETTMHQPELLNNTCIVGTGNDIFSLDGITAVAKANVSDIVKRPRNEIRNGLLSSDDTYNMLYNGSYPSEARVFTNTYGDTLPYRFIRPSAEQPGKNYPLVVFLHDFWERGSDNKRHLRQFIWQLLSKENQQNFPCYIVAPQLPMSEQKWKCTGLGSETWPLQSTVMLIDSLSAAYHIDASRIYIIGESLGAAGALNLAIHYPDKFAAVVPMGMFYVLTKNASMQLQHTPVWLFYGANDERIAPRVKQEIRMDLVSAGVPLKYTEVPDMGHRIWNGITDKYPDLLPWIFQQKKAPNLTLDYKQNKSTL
jgi:hypothetical protein